MYKRAVASFWTVEEVDLSQDLRDWQKLNGALFGLLYCPQPQPHRLRMHVLLAQHYPYFFPPKQKQESKGHAASSLGTSHKTRLEL